MEAEVIFLPGSSDTTAPVLFCLKPLNRAATEEKDGIQTGLGFQLLPHIRAAVDIQLALAALSASWK